MKFQSKPVLVEAWPFTPPTPTMSGAQEYGRDLGWETTYLLTGQWQLWVAKARAWAAIEPGDYVIREPDGSGFYPCAAAIFAERYVATCGAACGFGSMCAIDGTCEVVGSHSVCRHAYAHDPGEHTWPSR